jgi:hypothetical protein
MGSPFSYNGFLIVSNWGAVRCGELPFGAWKFTGMAAQNSDSSAVYGEAIADLMIETTANS